MPHRERQLVTKDFFTGLPFWGQLNKDEQAVVEKDTRGLAEAHAGQIVLRTRMGEHLHNLQTVLDRKGLYTKYIRTLRISERTSYRYIEAYKAVKDHVGEYALKAAAARGIDLVGFTGDRPFGPYESAIKKLPPPKDEEKVPEWLEKLEEARRTGPRSPRRGQHSGRASLSSEDRLKAAFRAVAGQYKKMPGGKGRYVWAFKLIAFLLTEFGIPGQTFEPQAVPEGYRSVLGRPKLQAKKNGRDSEAA